MWLHVHDCGLAPLEHIALTDAFIAGLRDVGAIAVTDELRVVELGARSLERCHQTQVDLDQFGVWLDHGHRPGPRTTEAFVLARPDVEYRLCREAPVDNRDHAAQ